MSRFAPRQGRAGQGSRPGDQESAPRRITTGSKSKTELEHLSVVSPPTHRLWPRR